MSNYPNTVFTNESGEDADEDSEYRTGIEVSANGTDELVVLIFGSDQKATEFLTRSQFEDFVTKARAVMGWKEVCEECGKPIGSNDKCFNCFVEKQS